MSGFDVQRDGGDGDSSLVAVRAFVPAVLRDGKESTGAFSQMPNKLV